MTNTNSDRRFGVVPTRQATSDWWRSMARTLLYASSVIALCPGNNAVASIRLNGALVNGGDVSLSFFEISPDGSRVVYLADENVDEVTELFSVPIFGGTPIRLNKPLVAGGDVFLFRISADGTRVIYMADQDVDDVRELFSVPLTGGTPTKISGSMVTGGDVSGFRISPNSSRVVYQADQITDDMVELFSVPVGGGVATKLNGPLVSGGNVFFDFQISLDSSHVVYRAHQDIFALELFSVALTGGTPIKLNPPLVSGGEVAGSFEVTPDSTRVVYQAVQEVLGVMELFSVPIGGGTATKLNGPLVSGGDVNPDRFRISPDSSRVVYQADQEIDGVMGIYSVPVAGGSPIKLNVGGEVSGDFHISHNSLGVTYKSDRDIDGVFELFIVPLTGGTSLKLHTSLSDGDVGGGLFNADDSRVVYWVNTGPMTETQLFSIPPTGGTPTPLSDGGSVLEFPVISPDGSRVVYPAAANGVTELFSVAVTGGSVIKTNGPLVGGGEVQTPAGVIIFLISPDSSRDVYLADEKTDDVFELFASDAAQVTGNLTVSVSFLVVSGVLTESQGDGLIDKLEVAAVSLSNGNTAGACSQYLAFVNQVRSFMRNGILSAAQGEPLVGAARLTRRELGC